MISSLLTTKEGVDRSHMPDVVSREVCRLGRAVRYTVKSHLEPNSGFYKLLMKGIFDLLSKKYF